MKRMKCTKRYGTLCDESEGHERRNSESEKAENMTQEMSQITNGHVANNNNSSGDSNDGGKIGFVGKCQSALIGAMERSYYRFGVLVANHYIVFILLPLVLTGLAAIGIPKIEYEDNFLKMWLPEDNYHRKNSEWYYEMRQTLNPGWGGGVSRSYPRNNHILVRSAATSEDRKSVLSADLLQKLQILRRELTSFSEPPSRSLWEDSCLRVKRSGDPESRQFESAASPQDLVQQCLEMMGGLVSGGPDSICSESDILELFAFNQTLNDSQVLDAVNDPNARSLITGQPLDMNELLGGVVRDNEEKIISAEATMMTFDTDWFRSRHKEWEKYFLDAVLDFSEKTLEPIGYRAIPFTVGSLYNADRDPGQDYLLMALGYSTLLLFFLLTLGNVNNFCVENRSLLSLCGIACVGMGLCVCYGLCALLGYPTSQMTIIVPFLLLGIGVDDIFVIVQCFNNLSEEERAKTLPERFGLTMKHAGVAITITSVTDLLAFGVGASSTLPALRSFAVFASLGIFAVFICIITFFAAWFSLDQRRIEANRNAFFPCYKHKEDTSERAASLCKRRPLLKTAFVFLSDALCRWPVKVAVLVFSAVMISLGTLGAIQLETDFHTMWYVRDGTYVKDFLVSRERLFGHPVEGKVYIYSADFPAIMNVVDDLTADLKNMSGPDGILVPLPDDEIGFTEAFKNWMRSSKPEVQNYPETPLNATEFQDYITEFLVTGDGIKHAEDSVVFEKQLSCYEKAPKIVMLMVPYVQKRAPTAMEFIEKMKSIHATVAAHDFGNSNGTTKAFAWSRNYGTYVVTDLIASQMMRNLLLATLAMFLATLFFLAHLISSIFIVINVIITITNVAGFMHFWGLTIETATAIFLTISFGLSVDYSAHVSHAFVITQGHSRNDRMKKALVDMGPAVFNGGFSTYLAFALLCFSNSYLFRSFFKVFFLVVVFGLFHGLVLLPTVLSICGPAPVATSRPRKGTVSPVEFENQQTSVGGSPSGGEDGTRPPPS